MIRTILPTTPEAARHERTAHGALRARGFSLVELMVSMVLGLLVVAGLINLFVANRKAYQVQSGNNYLQENLRIASDRLGWSLRMVDFWGGNKVAAVDASGAGGTITAKGDCDGAWATAISSSVTDGGAVVGYDGGAAFPLDAACIGGEANYLKGSDVLVMRYAEPDVLSPGPAASSAAPAVAATITNHPKQIFLLSIPGSSARLFAGTVPGTTGNNSLRRYVHPYQVDMYYLRPCSVPVGSTCTSAADGGMPVPTLMRMHMDTAGNFVSEPVVDGIEQLKFEYGVATAATDMVPTYATAATVTSKNNWANVVAVRVSVIAVNSVRDISVPHVGPYTLGTLNACSYTINLDAAPTTTGCANFTPFGGDKASQFVRAKQEFVVQLRNRVRG
jgi:prepilin-type N-terminal cleavage/methylation domain-containing protein